VILINIVGGCAHRYGTAEHLGVKKEYAFEVFTLYYAVSLKNLRHLAILMFLTFHLVFF